MIAITLLLYTFFSFILLLYGAFLSYLLIMLFFHRSTIARTVEKPDEPQPGVSIVVTFRNEAHNLGRMVDSLQNQRYNGDYEIILVNDCSTDNYEDSVSSVKKNRPLKIIHSDFSPSRGLTSKQQALDAGIKSAQFGWIACTDADMVLDPNWLVSLIVPALKKNAGLVFGHTVINHVKKHSFFNWFQRFQLETLFATAYTFHRAALTGSCMGNNMLFSKKVYQDTGGFDTVGYSIVEDMDLMLSFRRKKVLTASTEPFLPTAGTFQTHSLGEYFQQLMRWSRGGFRKNPVLVSAYVLLTAQNILLVFSLFQMLPGFIAAGSAADFLLTWLFTAVSFRKIHSKERALLFLPFYPLYLAEAAVLFFFSIFNKKIVWKSRHIS